MTGQQNCISCIEIAAFTVSVSCSYFWAFAHVYISVVENSFKLKYDGGALPRCHLEGKRRCWRQVWNISITCMFCVHPRISLLSNIDTTRKPCLKHSLPFPQIKSHLLSNLLCCLFYLVVIFSLFVKTNCCDKQCFKRQIFWMAEIPTFVARWS